VFVDTHCHLDFKRFDADRHQVVARARETDLGRLLNPGIDLTSSQSAINLADSFPEVYAAVGVHPNEAFTWQAETGNRLREMVSHPKVVAIGEIGLDYYRDRVAKDVQRQVFREQLALAAEAGKPVIIHNREATEDVLDILMEWHAALVVSGSPLAGHPGVLHSYSGEVNSALQAMALNFYIGISGPVTFQNARELQRVVTLLPLRNILIETDAPFLTPHPHRGKRNEPANVHLVAEKIADLHGEPLPTVASITTANAAWLFQW